MSEFAKYEGMRDGGASPKEVYRAAKADGVAEVDCFRLLRVVFGLTLVDTKAVIVTADGESQDLAEHQAKLVNGLRRVFRDDE